MEEDGEGVMGREREGEWGGSDGEGEGRRMGRE